VSRLYPLSKEPRLNKEMQYALNAVHPSLRQQVEELVDAMEQLLDDMGALGNGVSLYAKAKARVAFQPFCDPEAEEYLMPIGEANRIVDGHDR